jgi:nucleotide-binding universal stress UspA family protein
MEQEILTPLDGSPLAETVLPHAITMARATKCSLRLYRVLLPAELIHTWTPDVPAETVKGWAARARQGAHANLARLAANLQDSGVKVRYEVVVEEDAALGIIARAAQSPAIAMIAMATHGRTGIARWVFGSVADKVLHATTTPLLLIRPSVGLVAEARPVTYRSILVPLDGSMFADQALDQARSLATATGASLVVVTVVPRTGSDGPDDMSLGTGVNEAEMARVAGYLKQKAEQIKAEGLDVRIITAYGQPAEEILRVADEEQADLMVIATHGVGGVQQFWIGGVATKVVQGARLPILLLRGWEARSRETRSDASFRT